VLYAAQAPVSEGANYWASGPGRDREML